MKRRKFLGFGLLFLGGSLSVPDAPTRSELPSTISHGYRRRTGDTAYHIDLSWRDLRGADRSVAIDIPTDQYHRADRSYLRFYHPAFTNAIGSATLERLSRNICRAIGGDGDEPIADLTDTLQWEYLNAVEQITQFSIDHQLDATSVGRAEYPRNVHETLVDGVGDCGDKTSLLAGLLHHGGFETGYVLLFGEGTVLHMAALLRDEQLPPVGAGEPASQRVTAHGQPYGYCETTMDVPLGIAPPRFAGKGILATYTPTYGFDNLDTRNVFRAVDKILRASGPVMH